MAAAMTDAPVSREYRTGSDPRTLRDALGCFATGVTVVTCLDRDGEPIGLTANSFTSLSLDPPLLLVCVAKAAASAGPLSEAEHFAVNVLQTAAAAGVDHLFDPGRGPVRLHALGAGRAWRAGAAGFAVGVRMRAPCDP